MEPVKIDIYISDLLYSYDCVIVPDFGGFVANYAPAKLKAVQHQFLPPSKQISFNKNLKNNDGLLTNHISQRQHISFQEANQLIRAFVDRSMAGLKQGDKIKIEKVGILYLDPEGNIQFEEEEQNDFLLDSFGLQSFRALPIARSTVEDRLQEKLSSGEAFQKIEKSASSAAWKAAAAVFFLIASALFLNQQFDYKGDDILQYSFFSPDVTEEAAYQQREITLAEDLADLDVPESESFREEGWFRYTPAEGETTSIWVGDKISSRETKIDNTAVENSDEANRKPGYHVMGGCFSQYSNAIGLTERLKAAGFDASLLGEYKKLHAVSYGSFTNRSDAIDLLRKVQNTHNSSAWLLKKSF